MWHWAHVWQAQIQSPASSAASLIWYGTIIKIVDPVWTKHGCSAILQTLQMTFMLKVFHWRNVWLHWRHCASTCPTRHQRAVYNGHKRIRLQKFLSVLTVNGIIANVLGFVEGRRNGSALFRTTKLMDEVEPRGMGQSGRSYSCLWRQSIPITRILAVSLQMNGANIPARFQLTESIS